MPFVMIASSQEVLQQNKYYLIKLGAKEDSFTQFNETSLLFNPDENSDFTVSDTKNSILQLDGIFQQQILKHKNQVIARKFKNYPLQFDTPKIKEILGLENTEPRNFSDEDFAPCHKEFTMELKG